ncbi:hypothetical protein ACTI_70690 [Actinoplanes sp. OR16]|uniref:hypothetical protein n=1 Tax=Actinoplanes sp. OR16 TaxID=946334 RepID=UPI000F6D1262|nr:hypothetical protein [Actinoplanes sp. OR16]BBH70384.1 hypothetical protein ACTI_70690 [Actinoplanes sp. OR16]
MAAAAVGEAFHYDAAIDAAVRDGVWRGSRAARNVTLASAGVLLIFGVGGLLPAGSDQVITEGGQGRELAASPPAVVGFYEVLDSGPCRGLRLNSRSFVQQGFDLGKGAGSKLWR